MSTYTKAEVNTMINELITRINTANATLNTTKNVISSHSAALDAHNDIISTKAKLSTVNDLGTTVGELTERITDPELTNKPGIDGTLSYSLSGKAGETDVSIAFDIEPIDENNPVTYEVYGDGSLIEGLTFDAAAGTITGTPTSGGTATYIILAKSGSYGVFITVNQNFETTKGFAELREIVTKLRAGNTSDLVMGTQYTITMADETVDTARKLTYNDLEYVRYPAGDTDTLYAWANADSRIYTDEIAIIANAEIKDVSGNIIGTLATTPSYMKDYRIMITSVDTDDLADGTYAHNARFEFLDVVDTRAYDAGNANPYQTSAIRSYLTSEDADGFMVRLPADIRGLIVPTNIECVRSYNSIGSTTHTLTDKVFLPSAYELCGTISGSKWFQEGTKSLYYPTSYEADDTRIRYDNGGADRWWTRSPDPDHVSFVICIQSDGWIKYNSTTANSSRGIAPAFVIA